MNRQTLKLLAVILAIFSFGLRADVLEIRGKYPSETPVAHATDLGVSDRNLLGLDHSGKYGFPMTALSASQPKVIRILALKVNFRKEVPDDPLTTGLGNLDLRTKAQFKADEGHLIDPAPHNSAYFLKHLEALATYWNTVSNGRLILQYEVFPKQSDSAYQLDSSMSHYGLPSPDTGLTWFTEDAIGQADQDPGLAFADPISGQANYDAYIVFHAGSDQQNNFRNFGVYTPGDLYTGFIRLGVPIPVDNGAVLVRDAVLMPETVSQDGRVTALNAVMAHEFGHQLGLVDLYDTRTGNTAVGDFSLMDNNGFGTNVDLGETVPVFVQGVMPVFPDVWSRAYLGFVDIVEVTLANNIKVEAAELLAGSIGQALLVPVNADEYFLVENRQVDLDGDGTTALQVDSSTDVILWPRAPRIAEPGNNREYDYLTPGSGMLIWHVDELVARLDYDGNGYSNFGDNKLQWFNFPQDELRWDNHHQFMTLEEADGIIHFGREYLAGYGKPGDLFDVNGNSDFGPLTNPPSTANTGGYTGVTINDISSSRLIMTCDVRVDGKMPGWPHYIGSNALPLTIYDLNRDGKDEIVTAVDNYLLAYRFDGSPFFALEHPSDAVVVERRTLYGDRKFVDTLAVCGRIAADRSFVFPLAVGDLDGNGFAEIVGVTSHNTLICFTTTSLSFTGEASQQFAEVAIDAPAATAPLILDYDHSVAGLEILVYNTNGDKIVFDNAGNRLLKETARVPFRVMSDSLHTFELISPAEGLTLTDSNFVIKIKGAAAADFDRDDTVETAEVYFGSILKLNYAQKPLTVNVGGPIYSEISLGDIDNNGYVEILFCGDNLIYAYNYNGSPVTNFPMVVNRNIPAGPITCNPTLVDIDSDGKMEIFVATQNGEVVGLNQSGDRLENFPKAAGGSVESPVSFARSGDSTAIVAVSKAGEINAFSAASSPERAWNAIYGNAQNLGSYLRPLPAPKTIDAAIGYVYNYPNPASDHTTIRFSLRESGDVKIKFYDVAGDLVFDSRITGVGGMDNEYHLDCSQLASGVYFCQLETELGDRKHCSVAIVK